MRRDGKTESWSMKKEGKVENKEGAISVGKKRHRDHEMWKEKRK